MADVKVQVPYQVPIFTSTGGMHSAWLSWFNSVSQGIGGSDVGAIDANQVVQIMTDTLPEGTLDYSVPPILKNFRVTGGFNMIFAEWDSHSYNNAAYVEIYRSNSEIFAYAIPVGTAQHPITVFGDTPPGSNLATTWYYWGRIVSKAAVPGPFSSVLGIPATTSDDPTFLLDILTNELSEDQLVGSLNTRIDLIDYGPNALTTRMTSAESGLQTALTMLGELSGFADFDSNNTYVVDSVVNYNGGVYKCILEITSTPAPIPTNTTYWEYIGEYSSLTDLVTANAAAISDVETWIDTPVTGADARITANAQSIDALVTTIEDPITGLEKAHADITSINTVSSSSDSASAVALYGVSSKVNNPTTGLDSKASVTELTTANSTLTEAVAQAIFQTSTELNGNITTVETIATSVNGLEGQYTVKVDANGYVAGYGLAVTAPDGVPQAEFAILADKFSIAPVATNPAAADGSPFFHLTVPQEINGVMVPAGTYLKKAVIADATIGTAQIEELSADKITAGTITAAIEMTAATITGGTIRTDKFVGTVGHGGIKLQGETLYVYDDNGVVRVKLGLL